MAKNLNDVLAALPPKRRAKVGQRAGELATLKDLRLAVKHTQQDLAASLGVGQDTISRIERRSDSLLSTLRRYVQAMGGELDLVARFPNRPPVLLDHIAQEPAAKARTASTKLVGTRRLHNGNQSLWLNHTKTNAKLTLRSLHPNPLSDSTRFCFA